MPPLESCEENPKMVGQTSPVWLEVLDWNWTQIRQNETKQNTSQTQYIERAKVRKEVKLKFAESA